MNLLVYLALLVDACSPSYFRYELLVFNQQRALDCCSSCNCAGGKKFCTTTDTLTQREPDSMLAAMFSGRHTLCEDSEMVLHFSCLVILDGRTILLKFISINNKQSISPY